MSKVWCHYTKVSSKKAKCNICLQEVASSGGTTNLSTHLRRHHNIGVFPTVKHGGNSAAVTSTSNVSTMTSINTVNVNTLAPPAVKSVSSTSVTPWTIARAGKLPSTKSNEITNAVVEYIIQDLRPYSTIESPAFRNMLYQLDPRYHPPNRHTVSEQLIPALLAQEQAKLQTDLSVAKAVALTSDAWTSRSTESYLTITSHYLKKPEWKLCSKVLQTEKFEGSHTGDRVGFELRSAMMKWGIEKKVKVITVDNASNMDIAIRVSGAELKLGCFAHTLNLASSKALNDSALSKVLGKVRTIVTFFHKSNIATELLKVKQEGLNIPMHRLIMDCKTRWNSTYNMLERFLEQRPAILATLLDENVKRLNQKGKIVAGMLDSEIQRCEEFVEVMKIMMTATVALCEEKSPTAGLILPLLGKLRKHFTICDTDSACLKTIKELVGKNLAVRYTQQDIVHFLEEASALDPRTKKTSMIDEETWERIINKCITIVALHKKNIIIKQEPEVVTDVSVQPALPSLKDTPKDEKDIAACEPPLKKSALSSLFEDDIEVTQVDPPLLDSEIAKREVEKYRAIPQASMLENPLLFWKERSFDFPNLIVLAEQYLCVQASSVASERVFSTSGDIVSSTRACLKPAQVDALVFLKKNMDKK